MHQNNLFNLHVIPMVAKLIPNIRISPAKSGTNAYITTAPIAASMVKRARVPNDCAAFSQSEKNKIQYYMYQHNYNNFHVNFYTSK